MNFCKDCRHYLVDDDVARCARSRKADEPFDPVTGEPTSVHYSCGIERAGISPNDCGPTGKFFESTVTVAA